LKDWFVRGYTKVIMDLNFGLEVISKPQN